MRSSTSHLPQPAALLLESRSMAGIIVGQFVFASWGSGFPLLASQDVQMKVSGSWNGFGLVRPEIPYLESESYDLDFCVDAT